LPQSLTDLEAARNKVLQRFLSLGDFRPGTVSAVPRRCGKPACHCAQPNDAGHPQFRLLRKAKGKSVSESLLLRPHSSRPRRKSPSSIGFKI